MSRRFSPIWEAIRTPLHPHPLLETSEDVATTVSNFIAANNISQDTVEKLLTLLEVLNA